MLLKHVWILDPTKLVIFRYPYDQSAYKPGNTAHPWFGFSGKLDQDQLIRLTHVWLALTNFIILMLLQLECSSVIQGINYCWKVEKSFSRK